MSSEQLLRELNRELILDHQKLYEKRCRKFKMAHATGIVIE